MARSLLENRTRGPSRTTMFRRPLVIITLLIIVLWFTRPFWLGTLGTLLVAEDKPVPSDAIVVLAGDVEGLRVFKGGALASAGFAPKVYVSGPHPMYGISEAELAINDAVRHGYDPKFFEALEVPADSTEQEAQGLTPELRKRGVKSLLLVTSDYHTARAGRIWRRVAKGIRVTTVAAPDAYFTAHTWWKSRTGRKTAFMEWVKTLTGPLGV